MQVIPESPEVKAHAAVQQATGGREWGSLSAGEQRSARRELAKEHHPDNGGDSEVAKAVLTATTAPPRGAEQPPTE